MQALQNFLLIAAIGVGATVVMDAWLTLLKKLGIKTLNFAFIGRWVGHALQGKWLHEEIARARPIKSERALGWFMHYLTGVLFAALLLGIQGISWAFNPTVMPALAVGIGTVIIPLFVIQPCMGAGFAARNTPAPLSNCLRSLVNHTVFGLGLYLSAALLAELLR